MVDELRYSAKALARMLVIGCVMFAGAVWLAVHGPGQTGGRMVRVLGTEGVRVLAAVLVVASAAFTLGYARLLIARDRLAAALDGEGLTIRGLMRTRRFCWNDLSEVSFSTITTAASAIPMMRVRTLGGGYAGLAGNALSDDAWSLEPFVAEARRRHAASRD